MGDVELEVAGAEPVRRRGPETRAQILRVAMQLFTDKGFEATTTRDIANALGMNQSSLYYHFKSKDAIVTSLVEQRRHDLDEFVSWIRAQPRAPGLLRTAALRWLDQTTPEHLHAMRLALANPTVQQRLVGSDLDVRSAFDTVVDLFVDPETPDTEQLLVRMVFDTVSAALLSAHGTAASADAVLAAAREASIALTERLEPHRATHRQS